MSQRMDIKSSTGAMAGLFEEQKDRLGEYLKAFRLVECQVGALFAVNGMVVGLECFGHQQTFGKFFRKIVQSYALDALDYLGNRSPIADSEIFVISSAFLKDKHSLPIQFGY